jgi:DNA-binding NarL/FixJ family response regulator
MGACALRKGGIFMSKPKILFADDHLMVAEALVEHLEDSFDVVGIVSDGLQLLEAARKNLPDLIIADISMPGMSGMQVLRRLRGEGLKVKLLFLTMHADPQLAREAMTAGASGYLLKDAACEELVLAVRQVLGGNIYLSSRLARQVVTSTPARTAAESMTPRQRDVLELIVEGLTMKEVGAALNLSRRTVETHKYGLMQKLGVQTTAALVQYAFEHKLLEDRYCNV